MAMFYQLARSLEGNDEAERAAIRRELESRRRSIEGEMLTLQGELAEHRTAFENTRARLRALHLAEGMSAEAWQEEVRAFYECCKRADALATLGRERDEILRLIAPKELAAEKGIRAKAGLP